MNATLAKIVKSAETAVVVRGTGQLATKKYAKMIDTHWAAYMFLLGDYDAVNRNLELRSRISARPLNQFSHLGRCDWPITADYIGAEFQPRNFRIVQMRQR
jgi:hypothetical protein